MPLTALCSLQVHAEVSLPPGADSASVFLSLSGERGFKSNAKLGGDGTYTFYDMQQGVYYLRPLLR